MPERKEVNRIREQGRKSWVGLSNARIKEKEKESPHNTEGGKVNQVAPFKRRKVSVTAKDVTAGVKGEAQNTQGIDHVDGKVRCNRPSRRRPSIAKK